MKRILLAVVVAFGVVGAAEAQSVSWDDCLSGQRGSLEPAAFQSLCGTIKTAREEERATLDAAVALRKAEADAQKAEADAQKALNEAAIADKFAEAEKLKSLTPEFDPDKSGEVELKEGAGQIEGKLLAAAASRSAAGRVCSHISQRTVGGILSAKAIRLEADTWFIVAANKPIDVQGGAPLATPSGTLVTVQAYKPAKLFVRTAGSPDPGVANVLFEFHLNYLDKLSEDAGAKYALVDEELGKVVESLDDAEKIRWPERGDGKAVAGGGDIEAVAGGDPVTSVLGAQAIGSTLAGFAQLFATDFQVGGFDVDGFDDLFVSQVASCIVAGDAQPELYTRESLALLISGTQTDAVLTALTEKKDLLGELNDWQDGFKKDLKDIEQRLAKVSKPPSKGKTFDNLPEELKTAIKKVEDALKLAKAAQAEFDTVVAAYKKTYDELLTALSTLDGPLAMSELLKARAYRGAAFTHFLEVKIDAAGGSYYTKKNIWSTLGDMPFEIAGGAVIHYTLFDAGGRVLAADSVQVHSGYYEVNAIAEGSAVSPRILEEGLASSGGDRSGKKPPLGGIRR
ncbi:hypothetical protein [Hyphomonas sp. UBA4494]|uniref:hypothetical protein n=1 Tax=Hyphomonas sp. UBA4494 TaxID=1946631 RepID=UPI0025B7CA65|nr:hypothetical protein [Hyphomonas sp. UBA4494]